jgi:large subunit ribosomal protein L2
MAMKKYNPITPSLRFTTVVDRSDLSKKEPEKSLTVGKLRSGGRNSNGQISSRFRGGGAKKSYRIIDFKRDKPGVAAKVAGIEYDPNRSARIALLNYVDGEKRYIIAPVGLEIGRTVMSGPDADILVGNAMPLKNIPAGTVVHNIELRPGKGAQMARSAGADGAFGGRPGPVSVERRRYCSPEITLR